MLLSLREYQSKPARLADWLVWAALVAPGVVEQKDGLLQKTIGFRGPDLASSTKESLLITTAKLNNALKRLGGGWSVFVEAQRMRTTDYPTSTWPDAVSGIVDQERRALFEKEDEHFESQYFLTLVYAPPKRAQAKFFGWLFSGDTDEKSGDPAEYLRHFQDQVASIVSLLRGVLPHVEPLGDDETLTYLHSTISTRRHPVKTPNPPVYLDAMLPDEAVHAGLELRLGDKFLRTLTVRAFPSSSVPGILDELNRLAFEYRWVTRYIAFDKQDALKELKKYQKRWYSQRQGLASLITEIAGAGKSALVNTDAIRKAEDVDEAIQELAGDYVSFGLFTATVTVWGDTKEEADGRVKAAQAIIEGQGFVTIDERLNALDAWLGSHPGNVYANVRRPLINSLNLSHMIPLSAVWSGPARNDHLNAPAHVYAKTTGNTPFRLATNVGDVGHTLILGPTGAGKSTLLCLLALQWLRYDGAQVFIFDKGRSSRAATLGVGGEFYDLRMSSSGVSFQPLMNVDDENERGWAQDWLSEILRAEGVELNPTIKGLLWQALTQLGARPQNERTMTALVVLVQDRTIREALEQYTEAGPYGGLFDQDSESLALSHWVALEMEELMETPAVVAPVLSYLFHRLEGRFDGRPTLLILDEAWMFLDHPQFAEKIREWLKVLRKKRVYVVFATQSVADAVTSPIAPVILESCLTRILLPNSRAMEPETARYYKQLALNPQQVRILAHARAKREYYYQSVRGDRLFELGLESCPVTLAFVGAADPADQKLIDQILEESPPEQFAMRWLERRGLGWAAHALAAAAHEGADADFYERTIAERSPFERVWSE